MNVLELVRAAVERLLIVWLVLLSLVAYFWPDLNDGHFLVRAEFDPFVQSAPWLKCVFAVTMFAIGSLISRAEVREVYRRWPTVLGGTSIQYLSMPLLAYGVGRLFGLEGPWMIGIIMVGCVPGAMASNVLTLVARGNVGYSVSLTTSATLLSPLVVPWALWLALGKMVEDFSALKVCWELCWMVVIPVIAGYLVSPFFSRCEATARDVARIVANLTILWIIAVVVGRNRENLLRLEWHLVAALLVVNLGGYAAGYTGSRVMRLPTAMRRALTLEVGMQNAGLGSTLALGLFGDTAALPAALYTVGCMLTGTILARAWAEFRRSSNELITERESDDRSYDVSGTG